MIFQVIRHKCTSLFFQGIPVNNFFGVGRSQVEREWQAGLAVSLSLSLSLPALIVLYAAPHALQNDFCKKYEEK